MTDKKAVLLEAAIDLFSREGFWNTSTSRISKHANVATGTLFNYFASKEALIDEVYVTLKQELLDAIESGGADSQDLQSFLRQFFHQIVDWGTRNPVRFLLLKQLSLSNLVSQEAQQKMIGELSYALDLIESGSRAGTLATHSQNYIAYLLFFTAEATTMYAIDQKLKAGRREKLCQEGFDVLWKGITP